MSQRRLPLNIDTIATDGGEMLIGAFARKQAQRRWLFGFFGAGLIGLAALIYFGLRPVSESDTDRPVRPLRCTSCGYATAVAVPIAQEFPMNCPNCRQRTLQPLWQCRLCGEQFLPSKASDIIRCPRCGQDEVGAVVGTPASGPAK